MDKELAELIEDVRDYQMTEDDVAEQRVSYAYGNTLSEDGVSKDQVRVAVSQGSAA